MEPRTLVALAALLLGPLLSGCLALSIPVVPTPTPVPTATRALPPTRTPRPTATPSPTVTPTPTASPTPTLTPTPTNTPGPSPTPTATHTPTPTPVCDCSANNYDCKDFATHAGAQACFAYCWQEVGMDVHHFDRDEDGLACETLP